MAAILNVGNIDLQKKESSWCQMFWIFGIVFFTQGTYVHIFFSQVFECINPNNKELAFVLSVSIPYKKNYLWLNLVNERILHIFEIWYIFILMMLDSIFSKIVSNTWCLDIHKYIWRLLWLTSWVNCSSLYV